MPITTKIPIAFWGPKPPSHTVSCMTVCREDTVVTGSLEGQLIIWHLKLDSNVSNQAMPYCMLFAHSVAVNDVTSIWIPRSNVNSAFISLSDNGELCLWNSDNGCCLNSKTFGSHYTTVHTITLDATKPEKTTVLTIFGMNYDILICDPFSLELIYILRQDRIDISLIYFATSCNYSLFAITSKNVMKRWNISTQFTPNCRVEVLLESSNVPLSSENSIVHFTRNPYCSDEFLLISEYSWMIYHIETNQITFHSSIKPKYMYSYGKFIDAETILLAEKVGAIRVHRIHNKIDPNSPKDPSTNKEPTEVVLVEFEDRQPVFNFCEFLLLKHPRDGINYAVRVTIDACLTIWKIPDSNACNEAKKIKCLDSVSLCDLWEQYKPLGPVDFVDKINCTVATTSSSIYLADLGYMIVGRANGNIVILSAIQAACIQLLKNGIDPVSENLEYATLHGHTGPVSCLCYPYEHDASFPAEYLISGGADFTIRVWDLGSCTQKYLFCRHSGTVLNIKCLPYSDLYKSHFVASIGRDNTVCVINLEKATIVLTACSHSSPVHTVKFKPLENLMLTGCQDGSVYVWNILTGKLERLLSGKLALHVLEAFEEKSVPSPCQPYIKPSQSKISTFGKSALSSHSLSSVKNLIREKKNHGIHFFNIFHQSHSHLQTLRLPTERNSVVENQKSQKPGFFKRLKRKFNNKRQRATSSRSTNSNINLNYHPLCTPTDPILSASFINSKSIGSKVSSSSVNVNPVLNPLQGNAHSMNSGYSSISGNIGNVDEGFYFLDNKTNYIELISARAGVRDTDISVLVIDPDILIDKLTILEDVSTNRLARSSDDSSKCDLYSAYNLNLLKNTSKSSLSKEEDNEIVMHDVTSNKSKSAATPDSSTMMKNRRLNNKVSSKKNNLPSLELLMLALSHTSSYQDFYKLCVKQQDNNRDELRHAVRLLISMLHIWGFDDDLDSICSNSLKLSMPRRPIRFGTISHGRLMLLIPGWHPYTDFVADPNSYAMKRFSVSDDNHANNTLAKTGEDVKYYKQIIQHYNPDSSTYSGVTFTELQNPSARDLQEYYSSVRECNMHWQASPAMTTLHVISVVSLANTLICMRNEFFDYFLESNNVSERMSIRSESLYSSQSFYASQNSTQDSFSETSRRVSPRQSIDLIKTGWNLLSALHSSMLPEIIVASTNYYRPPIFHELLYHLFDESSQIHEASLSVMVPELDRMTPLARTNLLKIWVNFLPTIEQIEQMDLSSMSNSPSFMSFITDSYEANGGVFQMNVDSKQLFENISINASIYVDTSGFFGFYPHDRYQIQLLSVFLVALMVSIYPIDFDPLNENNLRSKDDFVLTANEMFVVAKALFKIVNSVAHLPASNPVKKTATFLLGHGYKTFQPYTENISNILLMIGLSASALLQVKMAESSPKIYSSGKLIDGRTHQQKCVTISLLKSSHTVCQKALQKVASCDPSNFIKALKREFVRTPTPNSNTIMGVSHVNFHANIMNMMAPFLTQTTPRSSLFSSSHSNIQTATFASSFSPAISSSMQHSASSASIQSTQSNLSTLFSNSSSAASSCEMIEYLREEIWGALEFIILVAYESVHGMIVDLVEIVLSIMDCKNVKDNGHLNLPAFMMRLNIVSVCESSNRIATASSSGDIALFDVRNLKCIPIRAHDKPVTCVAFTNDGKMLASYCHQNAQLHIWQIQYGLYGLLTSPIRLYKRCDLKVPTGIPAHTLSETTINWLDGNTKIRLAYGSLGLLLFFTSILKFIQSIVFPTFETTI